MIIGRQSEGPLIRGSLTLTITMCTSDFTYCVLLLYVGLWRPSDYQTLGLSRQLLRYLHLEAS